MTMDNSIIGYFLNAGIVVKFVMLLLLAASVVSWTIIFQRALLLRQTQKASRKFEDRFWSGGDLTRLYNDSHSRPTEAGGIRTIFQSGFKEFLRLVNQPNCPQDDIMEGSQRAMRVAQSREVEKLSTHLAILATIGSTSPYVGLFGTVWGIMTSFHALGNVQQATIAMVAPGISEALVATAMGLFAAIPAVIGYNRFATEVDRLANQYETFQDEFSAILYRQIYKNQTP
jgi:biopolymer transport protein TolQ